MPGLTIGIQYLTGYAVATDPADRERAEWPPHPARVFMALAAAHFETGNDAAERDALSWLEELAPPAMRASEADRREVVTHYVPPNDFDVPRNPRALKSAAVKKAMNILPAFRTGRQPRHFPRVRPHEDIVYLLWPEVEPHEDHLAALRELCSKVTRIGHSSSLVRMWVAGSDEAVEPNWVTNGTEPKVHLRKVNRGTLDYLKQQYNAEAIERHDELDKQVAKLEADQKAIKGKGSKDRKAAIQTEIDQRVAERDELDPHPPLRPRIGLTQGYAPAAGVMGEEIAEGMFDPELLVLAQMEGPSVGLETTLQLTAALRGAVMRHCREQPPPEWIGGHTPDGRPSDAPHLAFMPLPFVGHEHADGHVMGMALAFPKEVEDEQRGRMLSRLLVREEDGLPKDVRLTLGRLGVMTLLREERSRPPRALRPETWTQPSRIWASVTPIVLDRYPKADRVKDRVGWTREVAGIIAGSCGNMGLPAPVEVDIDKTSWHRGAPRARPGAGGFPLMPERGGKPSRYQVHAWLRFERAVRGPVLLGAGRYLGYGLCRPWSPPRPRGEVEA